MDFENDTSLKEWTREQPLTILALDPADRAVLRIADERDAIQKKTFTKWVNKHLKQVNCHVSDLFEDLRDGHNLISLLEVLTCETLPRERGVMRFHMLQNIEIALSFLRFRKIKLVNIRPEDIVDGNPKLTLGLIWTIILHFQISDIVHGQEPNVSARDALLRWAKKSTAKYPGVRVSDFTSSWKDGLAFNALIHRNRPDLVDWRTIRTRHVRERLETAFHIVEKEYGVTKLLDPEDVDTHEPDEKSLITYISSLHEVFPTPPSIHPLYDVEAQKRVQEYRELASQLHLWIREKQSLMQDRTFPSTLIELKRLASESQRFRNEEVPLREQDKKRITHIFRDLVDYFESIGEIDIEPELHIDAIDRNFDRLLLMHEDRERVIFDEIKRVERLQKLADKVQRELKQTDARVDELEVRVDEESRRLDRMHPLDAKHMADILDQDIRHTENAIQGLFSDVQVLKENRYAQWNELHKRVTKLHQRWVNLRSLFHKKILSPLSTLTFPVEERTVTRHTRTVLETRLVDTNQHFKHLQECNEWCKNKLKQLQEAEYGSDLQTVQRELDQQQREHKQIDQFHAKIDSCVRARQHFHGDELSLYNQHLSQVQKSYAELVAFSNNRLSDLESLADFVQSATNELMWLNQKEEIEVTRDWSDKNLNVQSLEQYYESLMNELEKREIQFSAVQDRGEALVLQHHPATKCIEAYMAAMQSQWAHILQLTLCLETHLKHSARHQQFFKDVKQAEQWIQERDDIMNSEYSVCDFTLDQGEHLLTGMQSLRDDLNRFSDRVQHLTEEATHIVPLKQRRQPLTRPIQVTAACSYKQNNMTVEKNEQCTLYDNSGRVKWRVKNSKGVESQVPGVCFVIPPPDKEALDAVERLRRQFDRSIALWQKKNLRLRQNMIFATIKVVKSWDLAQFVAMGAEQRNAIRRALNEDADKLLAEGDPSDPQLRRLRREMDEVNKLFDEFEKRARAEEESKNAARIFNEQVSQLQAALEDADRLLHARIQTPLPRDPDTLTHLILEHKEFEETLQKLAPEMERVQDTFRSITLKTSVMKKALERTIDKWNSIWEMSNLYVERLKCIEIALSGFDEMENLISDYEHKLAMYPEMPSNKEELKHLHGELLAMQSALGPHQIAMDQLNDDVDNMRRVTEKSRNCGGHTNRGPHSDLERYDLDMKKLNQRWSKLCSQVVDMLRSCENAQSLLRNYHKAKESEDDWIEEKYTRLQTMSPIGERVKEHLEPTRSFLKLIMEHAPKVEQINGLGGRFIREGKIYNAQTHRYQEWLVNEVHPSLDVAIASNGDASLHGVDAIIHELDEFNARYQRLLDAAYGRLKDISARCPNDIVTMRLVEQLYPQEFKTFRTEFNISSTTTSFSTERIINGSSSNTCQNYSTHDVTDRATNLTPTSQRPLKRIYKVNDGVKPEQIIRTPGILNPATGELLTIDEAIKLRILDVRTGCIISHGVSLSVEEAAQQGLIKRELAESLYGPCGVTEDGENVSMLEAIQRGLYDAEHAAEDPCGKRIKVDSIFSLTTPGNASDGNGNDDGKEYILENGVRVSVRQAFEEGQLVLKEVNVKSSPLTLTDAITFNIVEDQRGWVLDRNQGAWLQLDVAVDNGVLRGDVREILTTDDSKITLTDALSRGVINRKTGRFHWKNERLTLSEARRRQLIQKPITLKDIYEMDQLETDRWIVTHNRNKIGLKRACEFGILDCDALKSINDCARNELVTLKDAENGGVIFYDPSGRIMFMNTETGEKMPVSEAINRGFCVSVTQKSVFDVDCFKDQNQMVGLNKALSRGLISSKNNGCLLVDNQLIDFDTCVRDGHIRTEIYDIFKKTLGLTANENLSVIEAVLKQKVDPKMGVLLDKNRRAIPLNHAVQSNVITLEGAAFFNSLLNITVTNQVVSKTIKRFVSVNVSENAVNYADALRLNLIDGDYFVRDNVRIPVNEAFARGLLTGTNGTEIVEKFEEVRTVETMEMDKVDRSEEEVTQTRKRVTFDDSGYLSKPSMDSEIKTNQIFVHVDTPRERLIIIDHVCAEKNCGKVGIRLPEKIPGKTKVLDKMRKKSITLKEALERKIIERRAFDTLSGQKSDIIKNGLENTVSGHVFDFQQRQYIDIPTAQARGLIDANAETPTSILIPLNRSLTVPEAIERGIFDAKTLHFIHPVSGHTLNLRQAIACEIITTACGSVKINADTELTLNEAIRLGYIDDELSLARTNLGPLNLLDANNCAVFVTRAFNVDALTSVPAIGLTLDAAIKRGTVDPDLQFYVNPLTNARTPFADAIADGLIMILPAPFTQAENSAGEKTKEIEQVNTYHTVTTREIEILDGYMLENIGEVRDLRTGEVIPMDLARDLGIVVSENEQREKFHVTGESSEEARSILEIARPSITSMDVDVDVRDNDQSESSILYTIPENGDDDTCGACETNRHNKMKSIAKGVLIGAAGVIAAPVLAAMAVNNVVSDAIRSHKTSHETLKEQNRFLQERDDQLTRIGTNEDYRSMDVDQLVNSHGKLTEAILDSRNSTDVSEELNSSLSSPSSVEQSPSKSSQIKSKTKEITEMTLREAVEANLLDPKRAYVKDPSTNALVTLETVLHDPNFLESRVKIDETNMLIIDGSKDLIFKDKPRTFTDAITVIDTNVSIKEAIQNGRIDPNSALIKDTLKRKLVKLPEAYRKGLLDKSNVLDTSTSRLIPLARAFNEGLIVTPTKPLNLIDAIEYAVYNPTTGCFSDPFDVRDILKRKRLTLLDAMAAGTVDVSSTCVKNNESGVIVPLVRAIDGESAFIDAVRGRYLDQVDGGDVDLAKALTRGWILPAEARQAIEEKYRLCDESLTKLLDWITQIENKLSSLDVAREHEEELRNQINNIKQIKDDLDVHNRIIVQCGDQIRQLVLTGGDILSKDEVTSLEKNGRLLKQRYERAADRTERLLRRLLAARDELSKFRNELNIFSNWLDKARRTLEDKERSLSDLGKLNTSADSTREFVSDVIAHKADLRFITMAAQKFVDESKEYLTVLNDFRTSLPSRLAHIEPTPSQDSPVCNDVSYVTQQYRDLLSRANALSDRLSGVGGKQRDYSEALDKARRWLRDNEPKCLNILDEPVGAEPKIVEEQLIRAKALNNEFINQERLFDQAQLALKALLQSLDGQLTNVEIQQLETPVFEVSVKHRQLSDALANKCQLLDTALVQSQGVQDALDGLVNWLNQVESQFKQLQRPASLHKDRLDEQVREQRLLHADIDSHKSSVESITESAYQLVQNSSNARIAKKIELKLIDVKQRYEKLLAKCGQRSEFLDEIHSNLTTFTAQATHMEQWFMEILDVIESRDFAKLTIPEFTARIQELTKKRDSQRGLFEEVTVSGKNLIGKKDVTDTSSVRDRLKSIESQWKDLNAVLDEKLRQTRQRSEQLSAYEKLRDQVFEWLSNTEAKIAHLDPVAVDLEVLKHQSDQLKPVLKEYKDYAATIDKVNELGNMYDVLLRPDSPKRRVYSPGKRNVTSPMRRSGDQGRSPSPKYQLQSPVSPGGSSGFSSRRSSQDGFHLEELTPVQQHLSEINNRYNLLGVRLHDRSNEIDAIKDELRKHLESLRILNQFLDKIHRQLPKDSVPNTKDDADKINKQLKGILEEIYEKQSLLDSSKTQIKELVRRKSTAKGVDKLNNDLENTVSNWKRLYEDLKTRIKFIEDLKDFYDTHDNLHSWLNAKERMLTVLGPISSDSRMVQSQVQQVQVLREEFRSQQPQLQHLVDVTDQLTSPSTLSVHDQSKINQKSQGIQKRWNDLLTQLEDRAASLGAAVDTSREFDAQLIRLKDALSKISDDLDDLDNKDPEELLRKIENIERQLEGQRPLLADLEASGAQLCDVLSDPASRADIQSKLASIARQYNALQKKLDNRKAEIEASLRDGRQFEATCAKTSGWLSDELSNLSERLLISADREILQQQVDHHEPIYREVTAREHEIIMLLNKGRELIGKNADQSRGLQRELDKISQHWEKLKRETVARHTRLQTCLEHCKKYYRAQESFLPWLRQAEDKLDTLRPSSFKRKHMEQQLRELTTFRNEIWKKSGEYENVRTLGETFVSAVDVDKDYVKRELSSTKERWDKLNNDLLQRTQALEEITHRLGDFNEALRDLQHDVTRIEDRLASHDSLGGAAKDPKLLDRVQSLKLDAEALKKPLVALKNTAHDLTAEAGEHGVDASHLLDDVGAVADRIEDLLGKLDDRFSDLQSAASASTQFNEQIKSITYNLANLENELDSMKPPAREIKLVESQINETVKFIERIQTTSAEVNNIIRSGKSLVDSGFSPDVTQTRQQIETLNRTLVKLDERSKLREKELDATLKKLVSFYDTYAKVTDEIHELSDQIKHLKTIGSDVDSIKAQQDDFKRMRSNLIEPTIQNVLEVNRSGNSLIQTAANGVSTSTLEKDLERLNDKLNDIKDRVNERERKLDIGLLHSGKFQEALDGLAQWLTDTEEMVANQKPPSADYKVVKAQLQEQKFLKKMLLDRQNSMSSLFTMGNELAQGADTHERKAIEKQLKELIGRFDRLTDGAQQRTLDLERTMHVAKKYHDKLLPLQEWLDKTEKKIKDMELVPTDEEKIQQKIREHEALHENILCKKSDFTELTDIASNLMELVGEDEASTLTDNLQEITTRYTSLVDSSENVGQLLLASRQALRHLVLTYQDLVAWMDQMETKLTRYRVLAVVTEKLLEQMDDLADLTEEISTRQSVVDGTVDSGLELMKHISSDEALQLKDKLDSLQRRYNDLTSKGVDLLKHAQEALPLVQTFHTNHTKLVDWMLSAESILGHTEPREDEICKLEVDIQEYKPILNQINVTGPHLCHMSPGEGSSTIESLVTRANRRFDAIVEQVQRKAERIQLSKQRSSEVIADIDELMEWFRELDNELRDADQPACDPEIIRFQLKEQRELNDDISSQKGRVRDVISTAKKVLRESSSHDDNVGIREKIEDLREIVDTVCALSSERLSLLEQALPLSEHFRDTHAGLIAWFDDMEQQVNVLAMPALRPDLIAQQQDRNEMFLQSISEHKPLIEKLNKTGEALIKICKPEEGSRVQEIIDADNKRYNNLKNELRQRQQLLEDALQESNKFSDKLDGMLRALMNTSDAVKSCEPISAHPPKLNEQIGENNALTGDLNKREDAYNAVKKAASDVLNKAGNRSDPAIRDIQKKLDKLNNLWNDIQKSTNTRGRNLEDTMAAAKKFWDELTSVMTTLKDLRDSLNSQEPPAVIPAKIQKQQVQLQEIRNEMDQAKPELDNVRTSGKKLMSLCGEPDKPEVKKHIEDLDNAWENITALYARREENLIDAMEKAMDFYETLQNLTDFLTQAEKRFENLGALGTDIDEVKRQIGQLKDFKSDVDPYMVKIESLNRQAHELTERSSPDQAAAIKGPLTSANKRWDTLSKLIVERQRQLENALLRLGQFQHALNELLIWIDKTDETLDELKPVPGDAQILDVELAKLKVLVNDIDAHQTSVDTLNDAGRSIIEAGRGTDEASTTQDKLSTLNQRWRGLLQKATDRQRELESALKDAIAFNAEIQDLLSWLTDIDGYIAASKPVGGLPETASEQLERFMEVYNEFEENRPKVESVLQQGQEYLKKSKSPSSNLQHNLKTLKTRWDNALARASDKKIKLEIALKEATEFNVELKAFIDWLTKAEKTLLNLKPVSRVMEIITTQMDEHKTFQKDVNTHREVMLNLDKKGTHLKYFSQKQDVILIKNLLISVQHRWEQVVSKTSERTRALDHGFKEAKEFHEQWTGLMTWLSETERSLDELNSEMGVNDPEKIKQRIGKHREFQRALSAKQATYDATMKLGKILKEKSSKTDERHFTTYLNDLKTKWTQVCAKSVERQRKLEEALLYSGQFKDAIQALLDFLTKTEKNLNENHPVHGDLDTVTALVDQHKCFELDLQKRAAQMQVVTRTGRELELKANDQDAAHIREQLAKLNQLWDRVSTLTTRRAEKLEDALRDAEKLHKSVHMLLEWLSDAEMKLRFAGALPDDEQDSRNQLSEHAKFLRELAEKERDKNFTIDLAQKILTKAHPDAVNVIKHWITIIQSRWDEVSTWARQREQKLGQHMQGLKDLDDLLEELLLWLLGLENNLADLEAEALPEEIETLEQLIVDHQEFMENTSRRQFEVDRVCKARQVRHDTKDSPASRKVSKTRSLKGSQHDLARESSPDLYATIDRKQSLKGSRDHLAAARKGRASPSREYGVPDENLPHYGPRFPPRGSSEPEFKTPRVKLLWDRWRHVWVLAWERQKRLHDKLAFLKELEKVRNFSWDEWRKRFLKFMNHKKSRLTDLFRKMDKDNNGLIPRDDFIDGIIKTKFDTSKMEMNAVADLFDRNNSGLIDWKEFIAALRPDWEERKPVNPEAEKIHDEVKRLVMLCTCRQKFRVFQVGEGKYRFGESQKLRLVRILRSTVMVRVGGGWVALDEFLVKNDPCRVALVLPLPHPNRPEEHEPWCPHAKGRTNIELREKFILADGVTQTMTAFKPKTPAKDPASYTPGASGPITKIRERSARSVPMGSTQAPKTSRTSLSAGTPDSLSDNESLTSFAKSVRKSSTPYRTVNTLGSRPGSRPSSRPASRANSRPASRAGSTLSLDSVDDATPSRIPKRTPISRPSALSSMSALMKLVPNGSSGGAQTPSTISSRSRTNSIHRASSIPTLTANNSLSDGRKSKIPVYVGASDTASNVSSSSSISFSYSGKSPLKRSLTQPSSTMTYPSLIPIPVERTSQTRVRRSSNASDTPPTPNQSATQSTTPLSARRPSRSGAPVPIDERAPFK